MDHSLKLVKKKPQRKTNHNIYFCWDSILIDKFIIRLSEFGDFVGDVGSTNGQSAINNKEEMGRGVEDELNELIDLMTMAEETRLSEQMRELEQLEAEKRQRMAPSNTASSAKEKDKQVPSTASGLFSFMKKSTTAESSPKQDLFEIMGAASSASSGSQSSSGVLGGLANLRSINELFSNANDEFEREWQSVFGGGNHAASSHPTTTSTNNQPPHDGTISPTNTEFSLFASANEQQPSNELGLFPSGGNAADKKPVANSAEAKPTQTKQSGNKVFISAILHLHPHTIRLESNFGINFDSIFRFRIF